MNSFKRTKGGLRNQYLFHNVDLIVYLEGGTSYSKAEVYDGKYTKETNDTLFWKNIFELFKSDKKIKFKSVGSKTTVKDIAFDVINGKIETVYVAMDSEFDDIIKTKINNSNIIYSHGYSWENDVWNETIVKDIINELSAVRIDSKELDNHFKSFLKIIKIAVLADGYLFVKNSSFFPRPKGYLFCVECKSIDLPLIKKDEIEKRINDLTLNKSTLYSFGRKNKISIKKHCYGHFLADYCCQLISHYLKNRLKLSSVPKDIIYRMAINKFFQNTFLLSEQYTHYKMFF